MRLFRKGERGLAVRMAGVGVAFAVAFLTMVGSASAWTVDNLTASCGQLDAQVPHPGTYSYAVGSITSGTFTTTEQHENVTIGGVYANGLTTITVKYGNEVAGTVKWLFVNCTAPKNGATGPAGPTGKEGPNGATGATGPTGKEGNVPCESYLAEGIDKKPTVQFSGCNVQVVNGEGKTNTTNGEGNLVIGYDEDSGAQRGGTPGAQTGSHNLILGEEQEFTSFAGIVAGFQNSITGKWASVTGGSANTASQEFASVTGGSNNTASGPVASVTGGDFNEATGGDDSVSGGASNVAGGTNTSVSGGFANTASTEFGSFNGAASISGGAFNAASGEGASVQGGSKNAAGFKFSSIFGEKELSTKAEYEAIP